MIRGLVSITKALTRAPNGRWPPGLGVKMTPAGRDSTAVTHTPDREIPSKSPVIPDVPGREGPVKTCAYHATLDVAHTPPSPGVGSCWGWFAGRRISPLPGTLEVSVSTCSQSKK
ncbi:hypothetical protein GCM10010388_15000 [Streptomyces mauvecolor]